MAESGIGGADEINQAKLESQGFGLFVRSLVGLDRGAAKDALAGFLDGRPLGANQIEFVSLIVDHLTEHGVMPASLLYESPFTDISPRGPTGSSRRSRWRSWWRYWTGSGRPRWRREDARRNF